MEMLMFGWLTERIGRRGDDESRRGASTEGHSEREAVQGAYRRHRPEDVASFTELAIEAFPDLAGRISCFGADWLGRQFATDKARLVGGEPQILLLDAGAGEALQVPASITEFHERELLEAPDEAIALSFYKEWIRRGGDAPAYDQCVGYKQPLFLGGTDDVSNLEVSDFEVYWSICAQLLDQTRHLPPGTRIGRVSISK
ncbi:MAG: DUF1851 domain-containing protein [Alphaproteobacteria bacterium]|nr:MAG: DUF1851 domain-containing protein [Alphaproteobacteria bacterium]